MPNLPPIPPANNTAQDPVHPCEFSGCPNTGTGAALFGLIAAVPHPGGAVSSLSCPQGQHYACCPQHALDVLCACLANHILPAWNAALAANNVTVAAQALANAQAASQKVGTIAPTANSATMPL